MLVEWHHSSLTGSDTFRARDNRSTSSFSPLCRMLSVSNCESTSNAAFKISDKFRGDKEQRRIVNLEFAIENKDINSLISSCLTSRCIMIALPVSGSDARTPPDIPCAK